MKNELITKQFDGRNVEMITNEEGEVLFELYSVGAALGYEKVDVKGDKVYKRIRKDRIDKTILNADIEPFAHDGRKYITEDMLYDFMLEARTDKCKSFRKWVTSEVLPSIRKYGAYISENEEAVDQDYIKYNYGQLKETFTNCPIENLLEEYNKCIEWYKKEKFRLPYANNSKRRKGSKHTATDTRCLVMNKIEVSLENRSLSLREAGKFGLAYEITNIIKIIKDDVKKLNNKKNGGKLASSNKKIKDLQTQLDFYNPSLEDFVCIDYHPYSVNSMYESYVDEYGKLNKRRTYGYNKWINEFPREEITRVFGDVDLSKPTKLWLKFDCVNKYDSDNLIKSIQDMIVRILNAKDDNNISLGSVEINKRVGSFNEGKIYIMLKNI